MVNEERVASYVFICLLSSLISSSFFSLTFKLTFSIVTRIHLFFFCLHCTTK